MYLTKQIIYGKHAINQLPIVVKQRHLKHVCMIYSASAMNDFQHQQLNVALKNNDIETVNNITEKLNNLYPVKPKSVLCIDGKPVQFEIIKFRKGDDDKDLSVNGKCPYFRILIRRR